MRPTPSVLPHIRSCMRLGFFQFFERFAFRVSPCRESIGATSVNYGSGCAGARKFGILGEDINAVFFNEGSVLYELLTQGNDEGVLALRRWTQGQYGTGVLEYDEASLGSAASRNGGFDLAHEIGL